MHHDDVEYVFCSSFRLRNGRRIYAYQYGLEAFRLKIRRKPPKNPDKR